MDKNLLKAIVAIIAISIIFSINKTIGIGIFILAIMAMAKTYYSRS